MPIILQFPYSAIPVGAEQRVVPVGQLVDREVTGWNGNSSLTAVYASVAVGNAENQERTRVCSQANLILN
ncbi:hypothetical protein Nepgr_021901 [Nepenthes gracilis]|uniref:Uncharacterized protein n=1 Tax=Nepenthes gracilis TaxID=150966 RepID=A0AAD3SY93_NEPGR|nr:hypothetical protein Nepgr_021901 [Nepenthes gracilis]